MSKSRSFRVLVNNRDLSTFSSFRVTGHFVKMVLKREPNSAKSTKMTKNKHHWDTTTTGTQPPPLGHNHHHWDKPQPGQGLTSAGTGIKAGHRFSGFPLFFPILPCGTRSEGGPDPYHGGVPVLDRVYHGACTRVPPTRAPPRQSTPCPVQRCLTGNLRFTRLLWS